VSDSGDLNRPVLTAVDKLANREFAHAVLPRREFGAHKWGVGGVLVVAGGPSYIGAAALTAMAAGRAGAGIVNLALPHSAMGTVAALVPEVAFIPLPDGDPDGSSRRTMELIRPKLERSAAVVVGPGLGDDDYAEALLGALFGLRETRRSVGFGFQGQGDNSANGGSDHAGLLGLNIPTVVDADGLNWLAKQPKWWTKVAPGSLVLTPHLGELSRLTGRSTDELSQDPVAAARAAAQTWRQIVVLKYGYSVATDGERAMVAEAAPTSLASAGTGDVLAGTIGAFLAQGVEPLDAAGLALYAGVQAARRIERAYGTLGLVASDLPAAIAGVLADLEGVRERVDE